MAALKLCFTAAFVLALLTPAAAEERLRCLNRNEQRAAIADGSAIPLAAAIRAARRTPRDVVNARLCERSGRLVYLLTLLGRDGKVRRVVVDARNAEVVSER